MTKDMSPAPKQGAFEDLKRRNDHNAEYWSARDLQPLLGYSQWRRFEEAVQRAITSSKHSGNDPAYQFAGAGKLIEHGKGGKRGIQDFHLSRFACYLITQNGDPRKPEIARDQEYFAVQTRDRLKREGIRGGQRAIDTHMQVGREVRAAIQRIGGTPPENLPPAVLYSLDI